MLFVHSSAAELPCTALTIEFNAILYFLYSLFFFRVAHSHFFPVTLLNMAGFTTTNMVVLDIDMMVDNLEFDDTEFDDLFAAPTPSTPNGAAAVATPAAPKKPARKLVVRSLKRRRLW